MKSKTITLSVEGLEESKIPRKFWSLGDETYFGDPKALTRVCRYLKKSFEATLFNSLQFGLKFTGDPQTFKTFLMCQVLKAGVANGIDVRYTTLDEIADVHFGKVTYATVEGMFGKYKMLGIDDLDSHPHEKVNDALLRVLRLKINQGWPVLIATTYDDAAIEANYGSTVAGLLSQYTLQVPCKVDPFAMAQRLSTDKAEIEEE